MKRFEQQWDGEWTTWDWNDNLEQCCDCRKVHRVSYRVNDQGKLESKVVTDNKRTYAARRRAGIKVIKTGVRLADLEASYVAGFFDGEGSISILCNSPKSGKPPSHTLHVRIVNTNPVVIDWLKQKTLGTVALRQRTNGHRNIAELILCGKKAEQFLIAIEPFLRIKHEQAKIAIAFQRLKNPNSVTTPTKKTLSRRESYRQQILNLNAQHHIFL